MIVRVPIADARAKGRYDSYAAVAVEVTDTHLRIEQGEYHRIRREQGISTHGSVDADTRREITARADARLAVCVECEHFREDVRKIGKRDTRMAQCAEQPCTCGIDKPGLVSLTVGQCPLSRWQV